MGSISNGTSNRATMPLPPPSTGELITILSIDGGGIRGLIPAIIIEYLEAKFQELDGPDARIADYFDVIAGTSTGALLATMLAAPGANNRPMFAAKNIKKFYLKKGPKIFPQKNVGCLTPAADFIDTIRRVVKGPKYDGVPLHNTIKSLTQELKVADTLTNIIVPAFDVKNLQPIFFSTYEAKTDALKNAHLSDVCIGTSAAPTYFPAYFFKTEAADSRSREYHLVDGGVAANNPTMIAISMLTKEVHRRNPDFNVVERPTDYKNYRVISVGTGSDRQSEKYTAQECAKWGLFSWVHDGEFKPIIDMLFQASSDMVDIHTSVMFQTQQYEKNYLRIQDDNLTGNTASVDIATTENMEALIRIGKELLEKPVARVNIDTWVYEPFSGEGTNAEALADFAIQISRERKLRKSNLNSY